MMFDNGGAPRDFKRVTVEVDLVVVGGGMAGTCCAITAAREGIKVALVQDRPVLGGNASSEFRLWMLGATSHMGNNNRWSREGGVVDEIMVENTYRNPEGNAVILDTILLEKVTEESQLQLLLNTVVHEVDCDGDRIRCVRAFNSQNSTLYQLVGTNFCDASGDGVVGFLSGAAFRIGAESKMEYGELLAPDEPHERLLGHSLYFYTRDAGQPVKFVAPSYALDDITKIPRYRNFTTQQQGCQLWWIEWGGTLDTVHDTEEIKWELWRIVYGVWNYIKNSGEFPEAETLTLDWVGLIPGKRESRRFVGDYTLIQPDIVEQRSHYDAVSFGGWAIDLHPAEGVYSADDPCEQWHAKGIYQIPYRSLFSTNIENLFLAGRIISASHIAFGSTRVMATCAHNAQACGVAAAMCSERNLTPRALAAPNQVADLQQRLLRRGQYVPGFAFDDRSNLATSAKINASSEWQLKELPASGEWLPLTNSAALLLPLPAGKVPSISFQAVADCDTTLTVELRRASRPHSFTPDTKLESLEIPVRSTRGDAGSDDPLLDAGDWSAMHTADSTAIATLAETEIGGEFKVSFQTELEDDSYLFVCLMSNPHVQLAVSDMVVTGLQTVIHRMDGRVAKAATQSPPEGIGIDHFEFWTPTRRPQAKQLAFKFEPPVSIGPAVNVTNGLGRPTPDGANAWIASPSDDAPTLRLAWSELQTIQRIELVFDTDFEHPMESVLMHHPERVMPQCVQAFTIHGYHGSQLASCSDNHQTTWSLELDEPVTTDELTIVLQAPSRLSPAALFEVRCYGTQE